MIRLQHIVTFGAACLISFNLNAQPSDHDHQHEQGSAAETHLHGHAELTLVTEENSLAINLESPAVNIVGFEHKATSDQQQKAERQADPLVGCTTVQIFWQQICFAER